ncbi:MAG TPA: hypothetical protein VGI50_08760 [Solirubrobacteraceae bacterium]
MNDAKTVERLKEIVRLAGEIAGDGEQLALRNRAIEIAACAEVMLWSVAPDESNWLDGVYDGGAVGGAAG